MLKVVIYLTDREQAELEKVSKLMARDPQKQAYLILMNALEKMNTSVEESHERF